MAREFASVGVVGLGTMGSGIAEVLARCGVSVVGVEIDEPGVVRGRGHIEHSTSRAVAKGKLTEPARADLLDRIGYTTSLTDLADVGIDCDAIPEQLEIKDCVVDE